jgi:phosphopantetheinyl transferase (holo-ACP synthase)
VSRVRVGNDVVDLLNPRTHGRATDERLLGRVFDAEEQEEIRAADLSDAELWCQWAAKEAGFKVISKVLGGPIPFVHRAFKVAWTARHPVDLEARQPDEALIRHGTVGHLGHEASVSVHLLPGAIHAVASWSETAGTKPVRIKTRVARTDTPGSRWEAPLRQLMRRFSDREADAIRSRESAAVRLGARDEVARLLGLDERRFEIVCAPGPASRRPPRVLLDGLETEIDLSLSHDGRWIAWAFWAGSRAPCP